MDDDMNNDWMWSINDDDDEWIIIIMIINDYEWLNKWIEWYEWMNDDIMINNEWMIMKWIMDDDDDDVNQWSMNK